MWDMTNTLLTIVLNTSVSIFRSKDSRDVRDVSIGAVLRAFKSEQYAGTVKEARRMLNSGDEAGYKAKKGELPVVTFSGTFAGGHAKKNLKEYSSVVVLDIDDLAEEDLKRAQQCLAEDEFVFAYWKSPSNQGLKGLVRLEYTYEEDALNERHNNAFQLGLRLLAALLRLLGQRLGAESGGGAFCSAATGEKRIEKESCRAIQSRSSGGETDAGGAEKPEGAQQPL